MTRSRLRCLVAIVAGLVLVNLLLWRIGHTTTLRYTRMLLIQQASADSWRPMVRALEAWDAGQPIYETVFFEQHVKFQYPPSSLLLPLAVRSEQRTGDPLFFALNDIGLAATLLLVGCVLFLLPQDLADRSIAVGSSFGSGRERAIVGLGALMYFPVTISYVLGQIQTIVNAAVAVAPRLLAARMARGRGHRHRRRVPGQAALRAAWHLGGYTASVVLRRGGDGDGGGWRAGVRRGVRLGGTSRVHASARLHRRTRRSPLREPDGQRAAESAGAAAGASRVGLSQLPAAASGGPRRLHRDAACCCWRPRSGCLGGCGSPARRSISPSPASASRWPRRLHGITTMAVLAADPGAGGGCGRRRDGDPTVGAAGAGGRVRRNRQSLGAA